MKTPTQQETQKAMEALFVLRVTFREGRISHADAAHFAAPYIKIWNAYNKAACKKNNVPYRAFSLTSFIR